MPSKKYLPKMKELKEIQEALKAPKNETNDIVGFKYRTAERILALVRPLYTSRGCTLTLSDEIVPVNNGAVYVRATVTLKNEKGESESASAYAQQGTLHNGIDYPQLTGAASSYARKYALCGLFAIDDSSNDPDTAKNTKARMDAQQAEAQELANDLNNAQMEALKTKTRDELMAVWNKYTNLQKDPTFNAIMTQQKQALGLK